MTSAPSIIRAVREAAGYVPGIQPRSPKGGTYVSWRCMLSRCYNPLHTSYPGYGGRGITMCDRWLVSFDNFVEDMGPRPPRMTLDRRDVDGPYCASNCRWADTTDQRRNQRSSPRIFHLDRFGLLRVVEGAEFLPVGSEGKLKSFHLCQCDCGSEILVRQNDLRQGAQLSCGCTRARKPKPSKYLDMYKKKREQQHEH